MSEPAPLDLAIIGSGPAGLCTADAALRAGLSVRVYDRGCLAESIHRFPTFMRFHSTKENLELGGVPLVGPEDKPTRQEYLEYLRRFVTLRGLDVRLYTEVTRLERGPGEFTLHLRGRGGDEHVQRARFVTIATGGYDSPQRLGVPGEDLPKVRHHFDEPHPYFRQRVMIVGGKNSAVETALILARAGAHVTICHRGPGFAGVKYWLRPDIENRIREGRIAALMPAEVVAIEPLHVQVRLRETGETRRVENDVVLALIGFEPDLSFLARCGVAVDPATKQPVLDPQTLETNVPGLFCAGVILGGSLSGMVFIENARHHGEQIVAKIRGS